MNTNELEEQINDDFSYKLSSLIQIIKSNWKFFLLSIIIALIIAFLYLKITNNQYKTSASILVKDPDAAMGSGNASGLSTLQDLGIFPGKSNVDNELQIITSPAMIEQVVRNLQLYESFTVRRGLRKIPLYKDSIPFVVTTVNFNADELALDDDELKYYIRVHGQGFDIENEKGQTWKATWGSFLKLPFGLFKLNKSRLTSIWDSSDIINLKITPLNAAVDFIQNNLDAEIPNKQVTVINLSMPTTVPQKGIDFLNNLIEVYEKSGVEDNNRMADSTIRFINDRLATVSVDLDNLENKIRDFKEKNSIADIAAQSQALITSTSTADQDLKTQQVQLSVINSLLDYVENKGDSVHVIPAISSLDNTAITSNIHQYNLLLLQRQRLLLSSTHANPLIQNLDQQLVILRTNMIEDLKSVKRSIAASINQSQKSNFSLKNTLRQVPSIEKTYLEYSRQQEVQQQLYLFLLQQREQNEISKSSTVSNVRVISYARSGFQPIAPRKYLICVIALMTGFLFPFVYFFLIELFNNKIRKKEDIVNRTSIPILAEIVHVNTENKNAIIIKNDSREIVSEQFRILRTDLNFLLTGPNDKVILLTSSMPAEGKSFTSLNLGATFVLTGKKTVIVEMDLRKPKLFKNLNIKVNKGYSHFAIGKAELSEILYRVDGYDDLYFIPCGPIPPNPSELISIEKTNELFLKLKEQFDYVIIDTAPNIVTDARILSRFADVTLFLVRIGHTNKDQLLYLNKLYESAKFPRLNIVVNDIKIKKSGYSYYNYGYEYIYGYGNEYFDKKMKKKNRSRLNT